MVARAAPTLRGMATIKWGDLKREERDILMRACSQGINPKNRLVPKPLIDHLLELDLIQEATNKKGKLLWRPTAAGLTLIAERGLAPTFLHQRSEFGYTDRPGFAMNREPEVMDESATKRVRDGRTGNR